MRSNALWVMVTWRTPCEQTDMTENITFQLKNANTLNDRMNRVCLCSWKKYDFNGKMTGKVLILFKDKFHCNNRVFRS